jgi:hypothetical protein
MSCWRSKCRCFYKKRPDVGMAKPMPSTVRALNFRHGNKKGPQAVSST